ncbi:MAG: VOC family protein [Acidobacteria bacterium]|nr:VOC family protein [Acidobacteriota bacterium]
MSEARFAGNGKFVWYDMMSTDPTRSVEFYGALFGWTHSVESMEGVGEYTMLHNAGREFGGIVPFEASHGVPSHWMPYLSVADVDAAATKIPAIGGSVCVPPTDIPGIGRFAVVGDPTGAFISIFKNVGDGEVEPPELLGCPGNFCWNELLTTDQGKAYAFYTDLVGWGRDDMDMGPLGNYIVLTRHTGPVGGMLNMPPDATHGSMWLPYVAVDDADATAARIVELGGAICLAPQDIPGMGRFAVANDPLGAMFAIFKSFQT